MPTRASEFQRRLRAAFLVEAREHLQAMGTHLAALEQAPQARPNEQHLEALFRHTHSLKGAARAAGFAEIEALCHAVEDLFARCRRRQFVLSSVACDVLRRALDRLDAMLAAGERGGADPAPALSEVTLADLRALLDAPASASEPPTADAPASPPETETPAPAPAPPPHPPPSPLRSLRRPPRRLPRSPRRQRPLHGSPLATRYGWPCRSSTACCSRPRRCSRCNSRARARPTSWRG